MYMLDANICIYLIKNNPPQVRPHFDRLQPGDISAVLEQAGSVIGGNDLLIAAHALSLDAVMVTNNLKEFERVPGLRLENWV